MKKNKNFLPVFEKNSYIHAATFHLLKTGRIPSVITFLKIDVRRLYERIIKEYSLTPDKIVTTDIHNNVLEKDRLQSAYIELSDSITLTLMVIRGEVEIYYDCTTSLIELKKLEFVIIEHVRTITEEKKVGLIVLENGSLDVKEFTIAEHDIDLRKFYNDDFIAFDELVRNKLSERKGKGIVLLHGSPGTGKSSYLKFLIGKSRENGIKRPFIYLQPELSSHMASPAMISLLLKNRGSILLLEDSENLLIERKGGSQSAISNLLNLSDGILSDILSMPVICTFNAQLPKIDPALLRKGRLISRYHFKPLEIDKANVLLKENGVDFTTKEPMSLAEILNYNSTDYSKNKMINEVGFTLNGNEN